MKSRMLRTIGIFGLLLWLISALAFGQSTLSIPGLPGTLNWQNTPQPPAGPGAVAKFSVITYDPRRIENTYK